LIKRVSKAHEEARNSPGVLLLLSITHWPTLLSAGDGTGWCRIMSKGWRSRSVIYLRRYRIG